MSTACTEQDVRLRKDNSTAEENERIKLGWASFDKYSFVYKNRSVP